MRIKSLPSFVLVFAVTATGWAQSTASISGMVQDPSNAAVEGAGVIVKNVETGAVRKAATSSEGLYSVLQLPAGTYDVAAAKTGFKTVLQSRIALAVGQEAVVNLRLQLGPVSEQVLVTDTAASISTDVKQTAGVVTGSQIRGLPLNGRSYDQLLTLNPGIVSYTSQKNDARPGISNSAVANMFAVEGRRPQENLFLLDGIEFTGAAEINMTPGGTSGELLGVDAIREFNVLTGTYGAEYGKRPGAQVLVVSRSGSNEFHGSLYEFLRNSALDARNFFDRGGVPAFQRNQFGGSAGGALRRNRAFLFADYEGLRQNVRVSDVTLVPNNNARAGILPDGRHIAVDPVAAKLLALWPVQSPDSPLDSGGIAEAFSSPQQRIREDFGSSRFDQIISERDTLAASYTVDDSADHTPTANPLALDIESLREQVATLHETHTFSPSLVNTAAAGFSRAGYFYTGQATVDAPSFIAGRPVGAVVIGGSATPNTASSITTAGSNYGSNLFATRNLFTYQDQISASKARHQMTAGIWFQRVQANDTLALGQYGQATFANLETFLRGVVTALTAVPSPTPLGWRSWEGAWFVKDEFRVSPRLTLSLGFRSEFTDGWNEVHGRASTFISGANGALETQPRIGISVFTKNRAKLLPQPRAAFAWDPFATGRTVLRGGFGFYNDLQDALSYRLDQNAPFNTSITLANFPLSGFPLEPGNIPTRSKVAPAGVQEDLYTPTVIAYNLKVEEAVRPDIVLSIGYSGSHGYHETLSADLNQPYPTICPAAPCPATYPAGTTYYSPHAPLANPELANTWTWISQGNSSYNAFQADLRKRFGSRLQFRTAYTWSKSLDNGDTLNASAAANAPGLAQDARDLRMDWGPSTFDVRQALAMSGMYELPFPRRSRLLGGWSVNGILTYHTGFPFTPELSFNPSNNGNTTNPVRPSFNPAFSGEIVHGRPNRYFDPDAFVVPPNGTYGNVGRSAFTGPGLVALDISAMKSTRIHERMSLEMRIEAFNVLNHANFNTPNLIVFTSPDAPPSGSAGVITSTSTSSRQLQIAAKLIW